MNLADLKKPFNPADINWRVGAMTKAKDKAIPLAYLDARNVMTRLDGVCGPDKWQARYPWSDGKKLVCEIGIKVGDEWIWKANGAGDTNVEAEKGAFSDAFKRAAVLWGVGEYLYHLPNTWVPVNEYKQFSKETMLELTGRLDKWQKQFLGE